MSKKVYDFTDYRAYITEFFKNSPEGSYGAKTRLAESLNCNSAYISQVFNKSANFSLEQAEELNELFQHTKEESRFFLLLVQYARAGSHKLKERIKDQIEETLEKRLVLKERLGVKNTLSETDQSKFYSHWYYMAVHLIVTIKANQTVDAIAKELRLPLSKVKSILEFLLQTGLVQESKGRYVTGTPVLFLGKDSPMIARHHTNWRMKAIESLDRETEEHNKDLHFSSLFTYNIKDSHKIRECLSKAIDEVQATAVASTNEDKISCVNIDFFDL